MNDIAKAAGVSQSTVSRILNDTPLSIPVSVTTRERVLALALEFGYRPHPIARALRGSPTMLLGAVVRDVTDLHHTVLTAALGLEAIADLAEIVGVELVSIDAETRGRELERELRWNQAYYRPAPGV